jgi:hypothetical protein
MKMKVNEEDARKKWCPECRATEQLDQHCLASDCMAWVFNDDSLTIGFCGLTLHRTADEYEAIYNPRLSSRLSMRGRL